MQPPITFLGWAYIPYSKASITDSKFPRLTSAEHFDSLPALANFLTSGLLHAAKARRFFWPVDNSEKSSTFTLDSLDDSRVLDEVISNAELGILEIDLGEIFSPK